MSETITGMTSAQHSSLSERSKFVRRFNKMYEAAKASGIACDPRFYEATRAFLEGDASTDLPSWTLSFGE